MTGNIKGVTIEIGGNTTKLNAALKNISKESYKLDNELKKINNSLKFNPKNTDLLKQKFDVVNKSVKETGIKLEELKKIEAQLKGNPEHEEHWRKVQREIIFTENKLKSLEKEQKAFNFEFSKIGKLSNSFKSIGESAERVGQKFENAGKKFAPISAGFAAAGVASVKMSSDFEDAIAKVSTIANTTEVPIKDLEKQIVELSNQTGISSSEIAENVYNAISAGQKTGDAVNFVAQSTKLAKAGFAESGAALDVLTTIMNAYGLEASEVGRVSDILIQTQNLGKTTVGALSSSMGKVIPTANAYGVSIDQLGASYAIMTSKGIATAESTTYMNSMLNELGKSGTKASNVLKEKTGASFQELIKNGKSLSDVLAIIKDEADKQGKSFGDMFGSAEAAKAGLTILGDSAGEFNSVLKDMQGSTGATDNAFKKLETNSYKAQQTINLLKNTAIELGQQILEVLAPILKSFAEKLKEWTKRFKELDPATKQIIVKIGLFAAAFTPLSIGIGKTIGAIGRLSKGIGTTIKFFKAGESSVSSFGKAISKMTGVVKKIGGLGKTIIKFVSKFNLLSKAKTAINGITVAFRSLKLAFATNPLGIAILALTALGTALVIAYKKSEKFKNIVDKSWAKVKEVIKLAWENVIKPVFDKLKGTWDLIVKKWEENSERIKFIFTTVWDFITEKFNAVWQVIKGLWDIFAGIFTGDWDRVWNEVKTVVTTIWEQIKGTFKIVFDAIWIIVSTIIQKIYDCISDKFTQVSNFISSTWKNIKETISNAVSTAWNIVVDKVTSIYNSVSEWFGRIPGTISNLWGQAQNFLSSINLYDIGQNIIQGLANGLESAFGWVREKARNIAQGILNAAKSVLGINSPSRKMMEIGVFTGQGLSIGLDETKDEIKDKSKELSDTVLSSFDDTTLQGSLTTSYELSQNSNVISVLNGVVKELNGIKQNFNITSVVEVDGQEIARATHRNIDYLNGLNYKKLKGVW